MTLYIIGLLSLLIADKTKIVSGGESVNIPNALTAVRFVIIPFFAYFLYMGQFDKSLYVTAVILFLAGGITDVLDGYIARKFNMITSFGKLADPAADKLMQITALVILTMQRKIPVAVLIIIAVKEIFMGLGSILLYKQQKLVVSANWYGKMSTVVLYIAIIIAIFSETYSTIAIIIALCAALFAFVMYSLTYRKIKKHST
ncbi:cardiolipin synthase [Anaerobacterium chartisolvens]|uniref:CDP-diacylglycerol--glycerol-3-phosphate 3-phosphatidyltransferase n=1 Tax=Anaerobacterium chartisolvens TaxID=1297424 RepID=A0A369BI60_9FIRM|nr:cardiolipin synthase [Anaerobacterium chartisolvens]